MLSRIGPKGADSLRAAESINLVRRVVTIIDQFPYPPEEVRSTFQCRIIYSLSFNINEM